MNTSTSLLRRSFTSATGGFGLLPLITGGAPNAARLARLGPNKKRIYRKCQTLLVRSNVSVTALVLPPDHVRFVFPLAPLKQRIPLLDDAAVSLQSGRQALH